MSSTSCHELEAVLEVEIIGGWVLLIAWKSRRWPPHGGKPGNYRHDGCTDSCGIARWGVNVIRRLVLLCQSQSQRGRGHRPAVESGDMSTVVQGSVDELCPR